MSAPPHSKIKVTTQRKSEPDATPQAHDSTLDAAESGPVRLSKVLAVEIKGTLNGFNMIGPDAATWKPIEGKQAQIFGLDHVSDMGDVHSKDNPGGGSLSMHADFSAAMQSLKNVTITRATILQSHNTFPVPLGVTINCLPRTEVVDTGDRYTFTTIPNASVNIPHVVYQAGEAQTEANAWRKAFPSFTPTNLETQGILHLANCPFVFVNESHPVINLLRMNTAVLGVDIDTCPKMDGEWYKLAKPLLTSCCETIRTQILSRMEPPRDLTQMCVQLHRLGGVDWSHVDGSDVLQTFAPDPQWDSATLRTHMHAHERNFTEKPGSFMARIHLEYEMPR